MEPYPVGKRPGKERVGARSHPSCESLTAILAIGNLRDIASHEFGWHHLARTWLSHFATTVGVNDFSSRSLWIGPRLHRVSLLLHPGKECCQTVVVVLRPPFKRVVVAFGALHAHAKEQLGSRFSQVLRVACHTVKVGRGFGESAATSGYQIAYHLVEGSILFHPFADPMLEHLRSLHLNCLAVGTQNIRPFQRPIVGIFRPIEQCIDQLGAAV